MRNLTHFAKVFGIAWAIISVLYIVVIFRAGFGIHWRGHSRPLWLVCLIFYAWPVIPAAFIATLWELARVAMVRRN